MKLLLFSDLHADTGAARRLVALATSHEVDVLVGAGDFGNVRSNYASCLKELRHAGRPLVLVAGNNESAEELAAEVGDLPETWVLHGNGCTVGGLSFYGIGGGVPVTPFGAWSWDFTEAQAAELLVAAPAGLEVLVSHSPPKGVVDQSSRGQSLGSTAVREAVERLKPRLVVCGHIHGSGGQQGGLGKTAVVNAGPSGVVWEM